MTIPLSHIEDGLYLELIGDTNETILEMSDHEAIEYGESLFQIKEGCIYEYKLSNSNYRLSESNPVVSVSKFDKHIGQLSPNIYVGTLTFEVLDNKSQLKGKFNLEVQSVKTDYREDYRYMIKSITDKSTDLIMQIDSPIQQSFETDFDVDSKTLYQRFAFVKSEIDSIEFEEAVQRIVSNPSTKWVSEIDEKDIRNIKRFTLKNIKQLVSKNNRVLLDSSQYLLKNHNINSIPGKIESARKIESIDNSENRFIKHAIEELLFFCENCEAKFDQYSRAKLEAETLVNKLSNVLSQSFFKEVSRPVFLKLNSPVLQRKSGYREILNTWLKFDLAAKLIWNGGDNVYEAGKKDIAILYEYWVFFTLLDILKAEDVFNIEPKSIQELIQFDKENISLNLKQGKTIALKGVYNSKSRKLNVQFSYNRSFGGGKVYPTAGSYTTTLRPDYTLSIWPAEIDMREAENQELITHIHFDAKYKVRNFYELINVSKNEEINEKESEELLSEKEEERKGNFKNIDLLKMHAYKDAIRRTAGAYILYSGEGKDEPFRGFHELIPGLGAFVLKPNKDNSGIEELKTFILKVVEHFLDRSSQRENIASKMYDIYKEEKRDDHFLNEPIPEYLGGKKLIPGDTFVLVGYSSSLERFEWYEKNSKYVFRMGEVAGSLELNNEVVNAKYLLLRESGKDQASDLFKIKSKGPKVYSLRQLDNLNYPNSKNPKEYYLVIEIERVSESEFENTKWKFKELENYKSIIKNEKNTYSRVGLPFTVTLTELMKVVVH